jgi:hypothetical protein
MAPTAKSATAVNWDGSPLTLAVNASAQMQQTPLASLALAWQNMATQNDDGTLAVTSGGAPPTMFDAPALTTAPSFRVNNFQDNNVNVTNVSAQPAIPILVQMYGPGIPGITPVPLQMNVPVQLPSGGVAQGMGQPANVLLRLRTNTANLSTIILIGGPLDAGGNNGYVFGLNMPSTPPNYTKTTPGNTLDFGPFNWGLSILFVANLSPRPAAPVSVVLQTL